MVDTTLIAYSLQPTSIYIILVRIKHNLNKNVFFLLFWDIRKSKIIMPEIHKMNKRQLICNIFLTRIILFYYYPYEKPQIVINYHGKYFLFPPNVSRSSIFFFLIRFSNDSGHRFIFFCHTLKQFFFGTRLRFVEIFSLLFLCSLIVFLFSGAPPLC